jgi:hypothetical protein
LLAEHHYPAAFRALRDRLGADADRVSFAVPFINDEHEYLRLRQHLGLMDDTPLGVFVETPTAATTWSPPATRPGIPPCWPRCAGPSSPVATMAYRCTCSRWARIRHDEQKAA